MGNHKTLDWDFEFNGSTSQNSNGTKHTITICLLAVYHTPKVHVVFSLHKVNLGLLSRGNDTWRLLIKINEEKQEELTFPSLSKAMFMCDNLVHQYEMGWLNAQT